jgi:endonuclease YncB( thermonuclease family)
VSATRTRRARARAFAGASIVAMLAIGCTPDVAGQQSPSQSAASDAYTVVTVIDGDTLDATSPAGDLERIRLLGIVH